MCIPERRQTEQRTESKSVHATTLQNSSRPQAVTPIHWLDSVGNLLKWWTVRVRGWVKIGTSIILPPL